MYEDEQEMIDRATGAYYREFGTGADMPSNTSEIRSYQGNDYVVLVNVNGILAVYLIRGNGSLKRLNEWPKEIDER